MENPHDLLKESGIEKNQLSAAGKKALELFDRAYALSQKHLDNDQFKANTLTMTKNAEKIIRNDIQDIQERTKDLEEEKQKRVAKKAKSKKAMEEAKISSERADDCRSTLKAYNKQRRESGDIKTPIKRKLTSRLRSSLKSIANMIPKAKKEDVTVIKKTEKAIQKFISELKGIWGINKIQEVEKELKEKFDVLKEKAEQKEEGAKKNKR